MTDYKMWRDLPYYAKDRMRKQFLSGTEFEMSYNGENWFEMSRATSFCNSSYYRIKGATSMTKYKMWKDMPTTTQNSYKTGAERGNRFETSYDGEYWIDKNIGSPFYMHNYYRVKAATSTTQPSMITFGNLDPVKQGEILVAHRNNKLMMWSERQEQWTLVCSNCVYDSIVYCIKAAPRVCYVVFDKDNCPVSTTGYKVLGSVLMREVMED
jgi:hypothetical protein